MKDMNDIMERFMKYAEFNEDGDLIGIKKDAPEDAAKAYDEFMRIQEEAFNNGVKI